MALDAWVPARVASQAWASSPWLEVRGAATTTVFQGPILGWHKRQVPYTEDASYLQTLDIWIPKSDGYSQPPRNNDLPQSSDPWIVYIHGGAWRDPYVNSFSFESTAFSLLGNISFASTIAGMASMNYRLSPHPNHPTDPSPNNSTRPLNPARAVTHPTHINDVLTGLAFLQSLGAARRYILAGHSCGATLALQVTMDASRWNATSNRPMKPNVVVGLNGLYDLSSLIEVKDAVHESLRPLYTDFTHGAFGDNETEWQMACPTAVTNWSAEWPEGQRAVLVQSREDSLVPYSQLDIMRSNLLASASKISVEELQASGDHNELWSNGEMLSDILQKVLRR